jgi:hypothetical protein
MEKVYILPHWHPRDFEKGFVRIDTSKKRAISKKVLEGRLSFAVIPVQLISLSEAECSGKSVVGNTGISTPERQFLGVGH